MLTRPEKPDFFLRTPGLVSLPESSEYRLGPARGLSLGREPCDFSDIMLREGGSEDEKLVDCRRAGLACHGSAADEVCSKGGGAGRRIEGDDLEGGC